LSGGLMGVLGAVVQIPRPLVLHDDMSSR
jgi:hypothetical protein